MDDYTGWPLHFLVKSDHFYSEFLKRLEDPNNRDFEGNSLLHAAARTSVNNSRIMKLLLDRRAGVDSTNPDGHTPLHFAVYFRNRSAVATLLEAGVSINSKDSMGRTALHFAITEKWPNCSSSILNLDYDRWIVERLLCHPGINLNPADRAGETPLMWAVKEGNTVAISLLLEKGANPNIPNKQNQTPLHVLLSSRNPEIRVAAIFLYNGADIYCEDISGQTVVDILVRNVRKDGDTLEFAKGAVRLIALKYRIRDCLCHKLQQVPYLYNYFDECFEEVRLMREQVIYDNITLHDFCLDCYQTRFGDPVQEIYIPVFEILSSGLFKFYRDVILSCLSGRDYHRVFARTGTLFAHLHLKLSFYLLSTQPFYACSFESKRLLRRF